MVNQLIVLSRGEQMFIDNFVISEDDGGEPLAILPRVADALADLKPGTLRLLGGALGESLDNWLAHPLERLRTIERSGSSEGAYRDPDQPRGVRRRSLQWDSRACALPRSGRNQGRDKMK